MPTYEFRCPHCDAISSVTTSVAERPEEVACEACGAKAHRILSRSAVRLSGASKVDRLDPKYDRMVDQAMKNTSNADPDRLLKKLKPFSKPGD